MTFEETVRSMTAKEIIMAMVKALTHPPIINVDMNTFGSVRHVTKRYLFGLIKYDKKVCFGCAATNTICQISGKVFTPDTIEGNGARATFLNSSSDFLDSFECAINALRCGRVGRYNEYAVHEGFAEINLNRLTVLPELKSSYTNKDLEPYIQLANEQ